jgi:hypothetical protein
LLNSSLKNIFFQIWARNCLQWRLYNCNCGNFFSKLN